MLIRFFVENFLSFNELTEFSMIPGRGQKLKDHIIYDSQSNGINSLKTATLYGANASGKSNFVKSIDFARDLIIDGTEVDERIPVKHFRLDNKNINKPSKFQFDLKIKDRKYSYGFVCDSENIVEEWLYEISNKYRKKLYFKRTSKKNKQIDILYNNIGVKNKKEQEFVKFVAKGTSKNQLFLTESYKRNVQYFNEIYLWFRDILTTIFPVSQSHYVESTLLGEISSSKNILKYLTLFDTGISDLGLKQIKINEISEIPKELLNRLLNKISKDIMRNKKSTLLSFGDANYSISLDKDNELKVLKLITKHLIKNTNDKAEFDLIEESDGTQRLFHLIPALIMIENENKVFIIDELDRSLHPLLAKNFLQMFHKISEKSQLIVTTHCSNLLDLKLLRKDEIWFIEKNQYGESSIYSLEEFKPRYDKNIQKNYLQGRFGAIPFFGDYTAFK